MSFIKKRILVYLAILTMVLVVSQGCKKYLEVPPPDDKLTADVVFSDKKAIASAMTGLYMYGMGFGDLYNIYTGDDDLLFALAADDAINKDDETLDFYSNTFPTVDRNVDLLWLSAYLVIGRVNSFLEGVQGSTVLSDELKSDYLAQARLMRAFYYYNLTNLFGDIPLAKDANVNANALLPRSPRASVDSLIMEDLLFARDHLTADEGPDNYSFNQNTANVMLARMYAYQKNWPEVERAASAVINSGRYSLADISEVFARGNKEAIYQEPNKGTYFDGIARTAFYTTGYILTLTPSLVQSFDTGDLRLKTWILPDGVNFQYNKYHYPALPRNQEYVFFRLAEVILYRAEARAEQNNLDGAIKDLNMIRERAGIADLPNTLGQQEVLDAVVSERRKEYFAEGTTRWFDLIRWGKLQSTMSAEKPNTWTSKAALFPITSIDLSLNPNLTQTPGY
jgi:hypothetical protein